MEKKSKLLFLTVAITSLLLTIIIMVMIEHISPQTFQEKIHTIINDRTNQSLQIDGNAQWSFFPWFGFTINHISLNSQTKEYALSLQSPTVEIHISPGSLALGKIKITTIRFLQPTAAIKLEQPNYENLPLFSTFSLFPEEMTSQFSLLHDKHISIAAGFNFDVIQGTLNANTKTKHIQISDLNFHANHVHPTAPYTLSFQGKYMNLNNSKIHQPIHFSTLVQPFEHGYIFNNTHLIIDFTSPNHNESTWQLNGDIQFNKDLKEVTVDNFVASASEFRAQGELILQQSNSSQTLLTGQLAVPLFNCHSLLNDFDLVPDTINSKAISSCEGNFDLDKEQLTFSAKIDDTTFHGYIPYRGNKKSKPSKVMIDQLPILKYLPNLNNQEKTLSHKLNPLLLLYKIFSDIEISKITLGSITGKNNHCISTSQYSRKCTIDSLLGSKFSYTFKPLTAPQQGYIMQGSGKKLDAAPLLSLLPIENKSFTLMGKLDLSGQLAYMPNAANIHKQPLLFNGDLNLTNGKTTGFSLQHLLLNPSIPGYLVTNPKQTETFQHAQIKFKGFSNQLYLDDILLSATDYSSSGHGFIDLNSGVLTLEMSALLKGKHPRAGRHGFRILGTWPNTIKFLSNDPLKQTIQLNARTHLSHEH